MSVLHNVTPLDVARIAAARRARQRFHQPLGMRARLAGHRFRHEPGSVAPSWSFQPLPSRRNWPLPRDLDARREFTLAQRIALVMGCPPPVEPAA